MLNGSAKLGKDAQKNIELKYLLDVNENICLFFSDGKNARGSSEKCRQAESFENFETEKAV
jgi:hypothetical protein